MDPTLTQKEETYQVILDIIKNTPCYNAFLIYVDVPEIYKQQFWFTIKKVKKYSFCQFDLDNKTCQIDVELFWEILEISPRVPNQEFTVPPSNDSLTLGAIINRCLSGKTSSNDRLRPSRIEILWAIYHKANVDYATLIWEDLQYQIDNKKPKVKRREIMPYPRFTKVIIHCFMSQHKSISKKQGSPYHTVDKDGVLDRLKFISKIEIHQVYRKSIPDTLITDDIQKSKAYKTFIGLSTGLIPPKIGRGKRAHRTKEMVIPKKATVASK
ncbi:hypothetical protein Tco_0545602 [Tanacetum coccineum]